ncbi:hypothetical protein B0O99DRAFT_57308 [Bisporella sp. PMI_857]|nr:hypothetical protein B0O99DRAFT_57308 [Bisporella sp. PMI_857]
MGLFTRMVNGLYSLGRGIEGFSVMIGAGAFNNTDRGLCRECFMANKPDVELCTDCRIHWVCTMDPPDAMYHSTQTTLAVAALALGQSVFWINDTMNPSAFMKKGYCKRYPPTYLDIPFRFLPLDYLHRQRAPPSYDYNAHHVRGPNARKRLAKEPSVLGPHGAVCDGGISCSVGFLWALFGSTAS